MNLAKANLILAGAAVVLAIPTALLLRRDSQAWSAVTEQPRLFDGFLPDRVQVLTIAQPRAKTDASVPTKPNEAKKQVERDLLSFQRSDKKWLLAHADLGKPTELQGAPINPVMVENELLKRLGEIRHDKDTIVLKDAADEELAKYDLTEDKALVVEARDQAQQPILQLFVGKETSNPKAGAEGVRGFFVRKPDSREVLLYETPYWNKPLDLTAWLDKKLQQIEAAKMIRLSLRNPVGGDAEVVFERKPGEAAWKASKQPPETGAVRQSEVEILAQRFQYVMAQDFRMPLQKATLPALGLQPPKFAISATVKDGDQEHVYELQVGDKVDDKNEFYLKSSESSFLLTWAQHMVQPFEKNPKDLFDPPAPVAPKDGEAPKPGENKDAPAPAAKEGEKPKEGDKPKGG